ncbi:DNA/RNA-binding protein Alba-like domain-containing protein [Entamoeba marina]
MSTEKPQQETRTFKYVRPDREKREKVADTFYIGAYSRMSTIIYLVQNAFEKDNKQTITLHAIGFNVNTALRIAEIVHRQTPCHMVIKEELIGSEQKFQLSVHITMSLQPPSDTSAPGYCAPLTKEQLEVSKATQKRRRYNGRKPGYAKSHNKEQRAEDDKRENKKGGSQQGSSEKAKSAYPRGSRQGNRNYRGYGRFDQRFGRQR